MPAAVSATDDPRTVGTTLTVPFYNINGYYLWLWGVTDVNAPVAFLTNVPEKIQEILLW
jgi:hypothetical protein